MRSLGSQWKKGFDAWEDTTAKYVEEWMKSPLVLGPCGAMLTVAMKAKEAADDVKAALGARWACRPSAIRSDALHLLNQLQSRMHRPRGEARVGARRVARTQRKRKQEGTPAMDITPFRAQVSRLAPSSTRSPERRSRGTSCRRPTATGAR